MKVQNSRIHITRPDSMIGKKIARLFRRYPYIAAAYQYGSTVRGQEGPLSDLDIAIVVEENQAPMSLELLRVELLLAYELQKELNLREVDLVTLNHQPLLLQHAVLRTGILIYETDPKYRIPFIRRVIQAYLDFQPTLEFMAQFQTRGRLRRCGLK